MIVRGISIGDDDLRIMQSTAGRRIFLILEAILDSYRRGIMQNGMGISTSYETTIMEKGGNYYLEKVIEDLERIQKWKEKEEEEENSDLPLEEEILNMDEVE